MGYRNMYLRETKAALRIRQRCLFCPLTVFLPLHKNKQGITRERSLKSTAESAKAKETRNKTRSKNTTTTAADTNPALLPLPRIIICSRIAQPQRCISHLRHSHEKKLLEELWKQQSIIRETAEARKEEEANARTRRCRAHDPPGTMRRPGRRSVRAAALAIFFGALVLLSLAVDGGKSSSLAVIGGRRMISGADGERRTLEDVKAEDPFQDSKRKVPNGPDPIHNRGTGKSGRSPGRA